MITVVGDLRLAHTLPFRSRNPIVGLAWQCDGPVEGQPWRARTGVREGCRAAYPEE
jgi:hypothetical protein